MCAHSSTGKEITDKISKVLYTDIDQLFADVITFLRQNAVCDGASPLFDQFYKLKETFDFIRMYDTEIVFPSVLKVFNTKDNPVEQPKINIEELQLMIKAKETDLASQLSEIEIDADNLHLATTHPIYPLLHSLKFRFVAEKKVWDDMLTGWNKGCACFAAANMPLSTSTL